MKNLKAWFLAVTALCIVSCKDGAPAEITEETIISTEDLISRGEYLVNVIGCADCHTPKKMTEKGPVFDMDRYMMGFDSSMPLPEVPDSVPIGPWVLFKGDLTAAVGPWGTSFAGNLTPHETGIGTWTLEQFSKAIREGKYKGMDNGRPMMPPMPVEGYRQISDADLEAIFVFLKSIKPIDNVVPPYRPPGP